MKVNIYETDRFFHFLAIEDDGTVWQDDEFASEVPDELVQEYITALKNFQEVSRKLKAIKEQE